MESNGLLYINLVYYNLAIVTVQIFMFISCQFFENFVFSLWPYLWHMEVPGQESNQNCRCRSAPQGCRCKPHLQTTQLLAAMTDLKPTEWDQGSNPCPQGHSVGFLTCWATMGIPLWDFLQGQSCLCRQFYFFSSNLYFISLSYCTS